MRTSPEHPPVLNRAGMTLIEMLCVLGILGIIGGVAVTRLNTVAFKMDAAARVAHSTVQQALSSPPGDPPQITLSWSPSADELGGEKDVQRYALFRREAASPDWGDPFASIAAGLDAYTFVDNDLQFAQTWVYAVSAQDCTPANSDIVTSNAVDTPPAP